MGSYKDMKDATEFLAEHRMIPVVSHVLDGLESAEEGFELLKKGDQFGKVIINLLHHLHHVQPKLWFNPALYIFISKGLFECWNIVAELATA